MPKDDAFAGIKATPEQLAVVRQMLLDGHTTYDVGGRFYRSNAWGSHAGRMAGLIFTRGLGWHDPVATYEAAKAFVADPQESHGLACFTVGCSDPDCSWRNGEHLDEGDTVEPITNEQIRQIVMPLQDADWEEACRLLEQAATKIEALISERNEVIDHNLELKRQIEAELARGNVVSDKDMELNDLYGRYGVLESENVELRQQLEATQKVNRHLAAENDRLESENDRQADVIKREISRPFLRKSMAVLHSALEKQ